MQQMIWRNGRLQPRTGKAFLLRILKAHLTGQTAEEFADQELRRMSCSLCAEGWPLEDGQHKLEGFTMPCEATQCE